MDYFLTPKQEIVINLLFACLGESRVNRTFDQYVAIAHRVPKVAAVHAIINEQLRKMHDAGYAPYEICNRKAHDLHGYTRYESFPKSVSLEVVRLALKKFGILAMRKLGHGAGIAEFISIMNNGAKADIAAIDRLRVL